MKAIIIFGVAVGAISLLSVLITMYLFLCIVVHLIDTFFGDFEYHAYP